MDSLCTNPSEQGLGGQYGCGGQGCAHIYTCSVFQCARNIQVGTVLLTAQPSCAASQLRMPSECPTPTWHFACT